MIFSDGIIVEAKRKEERKEIFGRIMKSINRSQFGRVIMEIIYNY